MMEKFKNEIEALTVSLREELSQERESLRQQLAVEREINSKLTRDIQRLNIEYVVYLPQQRVASRLAKAKMASVEKQMNSRADEELSAYRKQISKNESVIVANARRVAISLARHCVELSQELHTLKHGGSPETQPDISTDAIKAVIFPNIVKQPSPKITLTHVPPESKTGWGQLDDDDDLFSSL